MPFTFNGFGTKYYGEADQRPDGSFVTTEWITALYVPVIPLRSFRLARVKTGDMNVIVYHSTSYALLERLPIAWPQVLRVYGFMLLLAGWTAGMGWLFFAKYEILDRPNAPILLFGFIAVMMVPFLFVWWLRREQYRARHPASGQSQVGP